LDLRHNTPEYRKTSPILLARRPNGTLEIPQASYEDQREDGWME